jgi:predicted RNA polymerase sigma factor
VHRRRTGRANWAAVVQLYDGLLALSGSPVVAVNRALAAVRRFLQQRQSALGY